MIEKLTISVALCYAGPTPGSANASRTLFLLLSLAKDSWLSSAAQEQLLANTCHHCDTGGPLTT
jgi:hypothetical protein